MAGGIKVDISQLKAYQNKLEQMAAKENQEFIKRLGKEITARLLQLLYKKTPVGVYPVSSGKKGGTLRRGWTWEEGGSGNGFYMIVVFNPVAYAYYVEYGHRTANHKGWVKGRFMLLHSEAELNEKLPGLVQKKVSEYIRGQLYG